MSGVTITVVSANLYKLALQYLGDATQWNRIAELNGTGPDPVLPLGVITTLQMPTVDSTAGGGIYNPVRLASPAISSNVGFVDATGAILLGADSAELTGAS